LDWLEISVPVVAALAVALLWALEGVVPFFVNRDALSRTRNLTLGLINAIVAATLLSGLLLLVSVGVARAGFGLFHWLEWHWAVEWLLVLLILDVWHYATHVAYHNVPLLWRLHIVHHHDEHIDFTTGARFHTIEIVMQCLLTLPVVALLGISMPQILAYELMLLPSSMFHHANLDLPRWLDRPLRWIIVTPRMHWVHHSRWQPETDSNYGAVLSIWDRLFGTLRLRADPRTLELGLDGYGGPETTTVLGMLATPLRRVRSGPGTPPPPDQLSPPEADR